MENNRSMTLGEARQLMKVAVRAGEIMLASGAETYRVEDTINRIGSLYRKGTISSFVIATGITTTLDPGNGMDPITLVRRIPERKNNLSRISGVNGVSRRLCEGEITVETAAEELEKVAEEKIYGSVLQALSIVGTAGFFGPLMGGGLGETAAAFAIGVLMAALMWVTGKLHVHSFLENVLVTIMIAFLAEKIAFAFVLRQASIVIACIMPLVPGAAITNAIRDLFHGDYMAATARILEATTVASAIAVGAAMGLALAI